MFFKPYIDIFWFNFLSLQKKKYMETFLEILKYILPSLVMFATVFFLLRMFLESEQKKRLLELKMEGKNHTLPIRLQAFERLTMYLERISPANLVIRMQNSALNNAQFQMLLAATVRNEFEHNLSQQMYISSQTWNAVKNAKEETIKIINLASGQVAPEGPSKELSAKIIEIKVEMPATPSDQSFEILNQEIRQYY